MALSAMHRPVVEIDRRTRLRNGSARKIDRLIRAACLAQANVGDHGAVVEHMVKSQIARVLCPLTDRPDRCRVLEPHANPARKGQALRDNM